MDDLEGPSLLACNQQSFPMHGLDLSPDDVLQAPDPFGFSPATSPSAGYIKDENLDSFFDPPHRCPEWNRPGLFDMNEWQCPSTSRKRQRHSLQHPGRLQIPVATNREKHGQLTPPSESTPTGESPTLLNRELSFDLCNTKAASGSIGRRRRSDGTNPAVKDSSGPAKESPRRKRPRKQSRDGSVGDNDDKRNQFLERNRIAASKCRQKKKEWTANLEQRARELQSSKASLAMLVSSLREELLYLKGEALKHTTCDCNNIREYLARPATTSFACNHLDTAHSPASPSNLSFPTTGSGNMHNSPHSPTLPGPPDLVDLGLLGDMPD